MDLHGSDSRRNSPNSIVTAALAGLLLGLAAFFLKIVMSGEISRALLLSPVAWIALMLGVAGFLMMQKSLQGYVSRVIPILNGVVILVSVLLAFFILAETISYVKWFGIFLILVGVFGLVKVK